MLTQEARRKISDALRLEILNLPRTPRVKAIGWYEFADSIGESALRIVVILDNETKDEQRLWQDGKPIRERVASALRRNEIDQFPYVRFITEKELASEKAA